MRRKAVARRLKTITRLRSFLLASRDFLACGLTRRPAASREGDLSYRPIFDHLLAELVAICRRLTGAEDVYDLDRVLLSERRQDRLEATAELHQRQDWARRFLAAYARCRGGRDPRLPGSTPQGGAALILQVRRTLAFLKALERVAPDPGAAVTFDPATVAGKLRTVLGKLESENARLEDARAAANASRCRADEAVAEYDRVVPWLARGLESFCHLAGEPELAGRVRSFARG